MTHVHADFLSGHLELQTEYNSHQPADKHCEIVYGPSNKVEYKVTTANDGQEFKVGQSAIKVIHTPGHTMESTCYLLDNAMLFTGDTLFLGDVGRPDLAANSLNMTVE